MSTIARGTSAGFVVKMIGFSVTVMPVEGVEAEEQMCTKGTTKMRASGRRATHDSEGLPSTHQKKTIALEGPFYPLESLELLSSELLDHVL